MAKPGFPALNLPTNGFGGVQEYYTEGLGPLVQGLGLRDLE